MRGKVVRFTRVVSWHPLANYDSICISSNKSRLSSRLSRHTRLRVFPGILHLLILRRVTSHKHVQYDFGSLFNNEHSLHLHFLSPLLLLFKMSRNDEIIFCLWITIRVLDNTLVNDKKHEISWHTHTHTHIYIQEHEYFIYQI